MQFRTAPVYPAVLFLTWVAILLGLADPPHLQSISLAVLVVLVVFLGIPHGATDLLIANHLAGGEATLRTNLAFLGAYLAAVALFAVLWWLLPGAALLLFSVLSCYHFGQSNLFYLPLSGAVRPFFYLLWGAYVLSGPILLNWGASEEIIRMIIGYEPNLGINTGSRALIAWSAVGGLNGVILAILRLRGSISARVFYQEVFNLILLGVLFLSTPLLLGFAIYFGLWHSVSAICEQISDLKTGNARFGLRKFYLQALPVTLISFLAIVLIIWFFETFEDSSRMVGWFFILIGTVTLPHMYIIHKLHARSKK